MSGKECFGVIIRTTGLALTLIGGYNVFIAFAVTSEVSHSEGPAAVIVKDLFFIVVGLLLLRGAPALLGFSYPPEPSRREPARSVLLDPTPERPAA